MALQTQMTVVDKMLQDNIDGLETHLDTLLKQKDIIQSIETYTDKLDFGDLLDTYKLLVEEIERTQQELQRMKNVYSLPVSGKEECVEEEEEETPSSSNKFNLEKQEKILDLMKKRGKEVEMSQGQILGFLRRNKARWYTSSEISKGIRLPKVTVNTGLRRLKKHCEVKEKRIRVMLRRKLGLIAKEIPLYCFKNM